VGLLRQITGPIASIFTLLAVGVAMADVPISSRPTFDCGKAKSSLALLICLSGKETARADWDSKIAYWASNFSLDEGERAAFWKDQDQWSRSLIGNCQLSAPPFSRQQISCVIGAYKERASLYRSKLSGDALAESQMTPEEFFEIQEALATLGFFDGEADGEFGPLTRAAIRRYQKANGFPQSNFLTIAQSKALLEGQTARATNTEGSSARTALSQETGPPSPPQQQSAPTRRALAEPFAEPPKQYSIVEVANESRACRPAFSNNCITLEKGERVVVLAWQIDDKPRRGQYCLRPLSMIECYYADLTAIEINGVPVPTIGMDKPAPARRVQAPPSSVLPSQASTPQSALPPQQSGVSHELKPNVDAIRPKLPKTENDLETRMGRVYERDNYYRGQKLDRTSPGWRKRSLSDTVKQVEIDNQLTAEEVFAANQKDVQVAKSLYLVGGPCKDCINAGKLSESELLRYWGLIRIHEMASLTLYNDRCSNRPSGDKAAAVAMIASQFRKLPKEVQERALDHEIKAIESVTDFQDGPVLNPGGWRWFCPIMDSNISEGRADFMFMTAKDEFFPIGDN
jgi:hypothetical protein